MKDSQRVGLIILLAGAAAGLAICAITWTGRPAPALIAPSPDETGALNTTSSADHAEDSPLEDGRIAREADGLSTQPSPPLRHRESRIRISMISTGGW